MVKSHERSIKLRGSFTLKINKIAKLRTKDTEERNTTAADGGMRNHDVLLWLIIHQLSGIA